MLLAAKDCRNILDDNILQDFRSPGSGTPVLQPILIPRFSFYIWHCVPNILLWSILCKTVGLPSSTGESERTARRQFHSPTLRCFRGPLCEVAAGRGPLKQSRWPESNWTLPLRSVGVAPSLGRFWPGFYSTQAEIRPKTAHHFKWLRW